MKRKWIVLALVGLLALIVSLSLVFVVWANKVNPIMEEANKALVSDVSITVDRERWIEFNPTDVKSSIGVIFYPGGKVNPAAYAPIMRAVAKEGYLTVITPMPLNMAFLGINKAEAVTAAHPEITRWVLSGHSLGGAMAANLVYKQPLRFAGLILYASWPADSNSLAGSAVPVLSIYGSNDGQAEKLGASATLLPTSAMLMKLEGANHAQFGDYGIQEGDGVATMSRAEQQQKAIQATLEFLRKLDQK